MLKLADKSKADIIRSFCGNSLPGAYIACRMDCYGFGFDFLSFWLSENGGEVDCVVSSMDNCAVVLTNENTDFEELRQFIDVLGFSSVMMTSQAAQKCGFENYETKNSFVYSSESRDNYMAQDDADLKKLYELISASIPGSFENSSYAYLNFLSDYTFRKNRGRARLKALKDENTVLSCALTSAETDSAAIISGVACSEKSRGKGFGKQTVLSLAEELSLENKAVYVIALNKSAEDFYRKIGFKDYETIAEIERKNNV